MSCELTDRNGMVVGSPEYFRRLNNDRFIGYLMYGQESTAYDSALKDTAFRIQDAAQEVYEDLRRHIGMIRYISKDERERLIDALLGFSAVCRMASAGEGRIDACISVLNLSDCDTRPRSGADDREIEEAAALVQRGHFLSCSDGMELLHRAAEWGEQAASGSMEKVLFLRSVSQGRDKAFLEDVWKKLYYQDDPLRFTGRWGSPIFSERYLDCMEKQIFRTEIPGYQKSWGGRQVYAQLIVSSLQEILSSIEHDLEQGLRDHHYLQDKSAQRLKKALRALASCGISCYSLEDKVDRLSWFVGGDPDKIRRLQEKLNEIGIGDRLTEDGVYGEKTADAERHILNRFKEDLENFLLNEAAVKYVTDRISIGLNIASFWNKMIPGIGPVEIGTDFSKLLFDNRQKIQRTIWKLGAQYYLRPRGYTVAAYMLEHSLNASPAGLYCDRSHEVTQKILTSNGFQKKYTELAENVQKDPDKYAVSGIFDIDLQKTGDTDLFFGIGKCAVQYRCERIFDRIYVFFEIKDSYNFDEIRTFSGDALHLIRTHFSIGAMANDLGFFSQADGVISPYDIRICFSKTVFLKKEPL